MYRLQTDFRMRRRRLARRFSKLSGFLAKGERKRIHKLTSTRLIRGRLLSWLEVREARELERLNRQAQLQGRRATEAYLKLLELVDLKKDLVVDSPRKFSARADHMFNHETWDWSVQLMLSELRCLMELRASNDRRVKPLCEWLARLKVYDENWEPVRVITKEGWAINTVTRRNSEREL